METQLSNTTGLLITGFLALLFLTIGVVLILVDRHNKRKAAESMSWLETIGTVIESKVTQSSNVLMSDEDGESTPVFIPEIRYSYAIDGAEYTSNRMTFGGKKSYSKRENAEKVASAYPVGTQLPVFYDPKNHKEAVSDRTAKRSNILLIFGILFIVFGATTAVFGVVLLS